ncbi:hypothetical protein ACP3S7_06385 [Phytobacter ursingii]
MNVANAVFLEDQTFIFSYGPLFWLVTRVSEYYNAWNYYLSISFLIFFYSFVIYLIFSLIYKTQGYLYFSLIFICFFSFYSLKSLLFLWPLIFLFHQQLMSERNRQFNMRLCFALGSMAGMFLYIRFFYGLIALAVLGGFLAASLFKDLKLKHIIVFIFSFIASSFLVGMMIYGHISQVFKYFIVNIELSYGNGVDMTLDIENYRFAFVCAFAILGCFITYGFFLRRYLLLPLLVTWALLFKMGFGRADHYISYFVVPCAYIVLFMAFDKGYLAKTLFFISFICLYYLGTHSAFDNSPKLSLAFTNFTVPSMRNPLVLPFSDNIYEERMAQVYHQYKLDGEFLKKIGADSVDIYPYNNEYMYANRLNYRPRPLFQNYMTLTPTLDKANADYFGGPDKPKKIIWNSGAGCRDINCNGFIDVDGKYTFNIDPLTSMAILENYKIDGFTLGRNNEPMLLLTLREKTLGAGFVTQKNERMQFGVWYSLPQGKNTIVKIYPDFKISLAGKLKNFFFRGNVVKIKYKLKSGLQKEYRLSIINSHSGVWASPLLDGFDENGFTGEDVTDIMFETDSSYYFEPEFEAKISTTEVPLIHYQRRKIKYNELVTVPPSVSVKDIDCEGNIDQLTEPATADDVITPLALKGWLAKSTGQGTLFDATYITLTDNNHHHRFVASSKNNRGDLVAVFGKAELENAGFAANVDTSGLRGDYTVSLGGRTGDQIFICRNLQRPLTFK